MANEYNSINNLINVLIGKYTFLQILFKKNMIKKIGERFNMVLKMILHGLLMKRRIYINQHG